MFFFFFFFFFFFSDVPLMVFCLVDHVAREQDHWP